MEPIDTNYVFRVTSTGYLPRAFDLSEIISAGAAWAGWLLLLILALLVYRRKKGTRNR